MVINMKRNHMKFCLLYLSFILIGITLSARNVRGEESKTIKVGYFNTPGFSETGQEDTVSGYQVEYIKKLSDYTGWNYEFIEVKNIPEASNKLINGEIDLLAPVMKTENYKGRFLFSEHSMGVQYGALLTRQDNHSLTYADYNSFHGIRIGIVSQTGVAGSFMNLAKNNDFEPQYIEFDTTEEMFQALENNEIEGAVADLSWMLNSMKVLAEFTPSPVYFVTNVTNQELMTEINEAIGWLKLEEPFYENNLAEKYFAEFDGIPLTQEENAYIQQAPILRVGYVMGLEPLSYKKQGKGAGILVDILKMIQKNTGLYFELIPLETEQIDRETLERLELDLILGIEKNAEYEEIGQMKFTNPIYNSINVFVGKKGIQINENEEFKVAICKEWAKQQAELTQKYPKIILIQYDTPAECLNAVENGDVKVMLQNQQVVKYHLGRPIYENLEIIPQAIVEEELSIAILFGHQPDHRLRTIENPLLVNILNKGIKQIKDTDIEMCVLANSVGLPRIQNFVDVLYTYQNLLIVLGIVACISIVVIARIAKTHSDNMKRIRKNEQELSCLTNNINGGVIALKANEALQIDFINNGLIRMLNMDERAIKNLLGSSFLTLVHEEDRENLKNLEQKGNDTGYDFSREIRIKTSEGKFIPVILQGILNQEKRKEATYYCVVMDISEQKEMIVKLSEERERFSMVLEQSEDIIFDVNIKRDKVNFSNKFEEVFGDSYRWKSFRSGLDMGHIFPDDVKIMKEIGRQIHEGVEKICVRVRLLNKEGKYVWCEIRMGCVRRDGEPVRMVGKITDIDASVKEKERLEQKNKLDPMTGLLNKGSFHTLVETYLQNKEEICGALLFIDLDNFKTLNDTLGHMTGDVVLKEVGRIITELFRTQDFLARFGGDEFVIFSPGIMKNEFAQLAETLRERLVLTYYTEDKKIAVTISASMGYTYTDGKDRDYHLLMEQADKALYGAKMKGKNLLIEYEQLLERPN